MDYLDRKISIKNTNIHKLIKQLADGEFLIPTFQRLFVWNPEDIRNLWNSIYRCYPVGSILYWKTKVQLHVHRKVGGFYIPGEKTTNDSFRAYILDGQQRATSLQVSYYGGTGKIKEIYDFDFTLYFDLKNETFFFENEYYRHRWDVDSTLLLRLKEVPDLPYDYCRQLSGTSPDVERNYEQLKYMFSGYDIPLICLEGFDVSSVCAVFERINQTGIRLNHTDILIARGFQDSNIIVEEDFPIKK